MHGIRRTGAANQHGATLLAVLVFLSLLGAVVAAYTFSVQAALRLRGAALRERQAFYTAEAGLNVGISRFVNRFKANAVPDQADFDQTIALGQREARVHLDPLPNCTPCEPTVIPVGEVFGGLHTIPYRYTIRSESVNVADESEVQIGGDFDIHNIPIFQFLAFIDNHLFIMPLPVASLHGRIHTNHNLYLQSDSTLRIDDRPPEITDVQVTAAGDIYRGGYKYNNSWRCWGKVYVDKLEDVAAPLDNNDPLELPCGGSSPVPDATLAKWKGAITAHVKNIITPDVGIIARGSGEYWKKADLRVVLNLEAGREETNFGADGLCLGAGGLGQPAGGLYPVEVQRTDGSRDNGRTAQLHRFMCERRGSIFYNEIPQRFGERGEPKNCTLCIDGSPANEYEPAFAAQSRVFRRVGEDTSGDGIVDTRDRNDDICPPGSPGWKPASCTGRPAGAWYADMDYRRGGFWNPREKQWMRLLNVNLRTLIGWNAANGDVLFEHDDTSDGGLVFFLSVAGPYSTATNTSSRAGNNYGVRIFDSADLDPGDTTFPWPPPADPTGLTVVSDQAVIVEGNYNKRHKYPAAIMGDAIYTLSQGWEVPTGSSCLKSGDSPPRRNDQKSAANLSTGRRNIPATDCPGGAGGRTRFDGKDDLVINAAWLFGLGPSSRNPDWYNGGLENFPKYLESWRGRELNYRGSFVSLGDPQHKLNNWACGSGNACNVYNPPSRDFDYDADFNRVEWLPPLTPKIVYPQQRLYTRFFQ